MSRRRQRVSTGTTNLSISNHGEKIVRPRMPLRSTQEDRHRLIHKNIFPPREKPVRSRKEPAYAPLKNVHEVPKRVDYDALFGYDKLAAIKVRTRHELLEKQRRAKRPSVYSTDIDGDGNIDSTEVRLAAIMRSFKDRNLSEEDRVLLGRRLMAQELLNTVDDAGMYRLGPEYRGISRTEAIESIAHDPYFRNRYNNLVVKAATAKLMSSSDAKDTLQQMVTARRRAEELHATNKAKHERNIWRASQSRAAELARNINTADRFYHAAHGFKSMTDLSKLIAQNKNAALKR